MKKFLIMGVLAVAVAVVSQQQASAWVNWKFGIGANLGYQSGGNCLLWGLFRNGQPPGPAGFGVPGPGCGVPGPGPVGPGPVGPVPYGYAAPPVMDHGAAGYQALPPGAIPGRVQSYQR